jgi:hypothetical protein
MSALYINIYNMLKCVDAIVHESPHLTSSLLSILLSNAHGHVAQVLDTYIYIYVYIYMYIYTYYIHRMQKLPVHIGAFLLAQVPTVVHPLNLQTIIRCEDC